MDSFRLWIRSLNSQHAVVSSDLSPSTLSVQSKHDLQMDKPKEVDQKNVDWTKMYELEERLRTEREERNKLELEMEKLRQEREALEVQKEQETGSLTTKNHRLLTFLVSPVLAKCRRFCDDRKQTRASGNGASSVQGAGVLSAGQAGLCHQGLT